MHKYVYEHVPWSPGKFLHNKNSLISRQAISVFQHCSQTLSRIEMLKKSMQRGLDMCVIVCVQINACTFTILLFLYSMRVLPHHQDTGGFFIAILEKKDWLPWQRKQRRTQQSTVTETTTTKAESLEQSDTNIEPSSDVGDKMNVVPRLGDLALKATTSATVEPSKEVTEKRSDTEDSACTNVADSKEGNNGVDASERTTLSSIEPKSADIDTSTGGEKVEKIESDGGQERPSKAVLGK